MKHDPRQYAEWMQLEAEQELNRRRNAVQQRLFIAALGMAALGAGIWVLIINPLWR
jgi:hypothetical protein